MPSILVSVYLKPGSLTVITTAAGLSLRRLASFLLSRTRSEFRVALPSQGFKNQPARPRILHEASCHTSRSIFEW